MLKSCFPDHSSTGLMMQGGGRAILVEASQMKQDSLVNSSLSRKTSFTVMRWAQVKKSWIADTMSSPLLGEHRFCATLIKTRASVLASSVWGTWRFISSPSKSALYGVHTHSLNLKVLHGITLTRCAMMDILCRDGCLLKRTISPSSRCLSTTSPTWISSAIFFLLPYLRYVLLLPPLDTTKQAPGWTVIPLFTHLLSFSMLYLFTLSG
mmetsp:Transcript_9145/g.27734  ORF Transcript_9145/g.27734 Transcript_9145/m.27734 type:complete len:209 (-) Transcript_9145:1195-1821(-)